MTRRAAPAATTTATGRRRPRRAGPASTPRPAARAGCGWPLPRPRAGDGQAFQRLPIVSERSTPSASWSCRPAASEPAVYLMPNRYFSTRLPSNPSTAARPCCINDDAHQLAFAARQRRPQRPLPRLREHPRRGIVHGDPVTPSRQGQGCASSLCIGNICRGLDGRGRDARQLSRAGSTNIEVDSAGTLKPEEGIQRCTVNWGSP